MDSGLVVTDGEEGVVLLDEDEANAFRSMFEAAMVSGCPTCRSRMLAVLAFTDALQDAPPVGVAHELDLLAAEAPTMHIYVIDRAVVCEHRAWRDPGYDEWAEVADEIEAYLDR